MNICSGAHIFLELHQETRLRRRCTEWKVAAPSHRAGRCEGALAERRHAEIDKVVSSLSPQRRHKCESEREASNFFAIWMFMRGPKYWKLE